MEIKPTTKINNSNPLKGQKSHTVMRMLKEWLEEADIVEITGLLTQIVLDDKLREGLLKQYENLKD